MIMPPLPTRRRLLAAAGLSAAAGACSPLTALNAVMPADAGSHRVAQGVAYGDGERRRLDVYAPAQRAGRAPVMVFFYGGSWNNGSKDDYSFVGHAFASRGFVTVIPDYRLVPEVRFPAFVDDCADAVAWAARHSGDYGGDGGSLHLCGHSAGAYNAVMLGLDGRFLRRAGARAPRSVAGLAGPYDFLPLDGRVTRAAFGAYPRAAETQPISFARAGAPRMFLATGDQDTTVLPRHTAELARRLLAAGSPVTTRTYPGVGHPGLVLALGTGFRRNAPVLDDVVQHARG